MPADKTIAEARRLIVEFHGDKRKVSFLSDSDFAAYCSNCPPTYRVSPVYPLRPQIDPARLAACGVSYFIGFFIVEDTYSCLSQLKNSLPTDLKLSVWLSLGLASIVAVGEKPEDLDAVQKVAKDGLRASEIWKVVKGTATKTGTSTWFAKPAKVAASDFAFEIPQELDQECRKLLTEASNCLNSAVSSAARFVPDSLEVFRQLVPHIRSIVSGLTDIPPESEQIEQNLRRAKSRLAYVDDLIQINAGLSHLISQAYSGAIPVLSHECQIRSHSLLGIGTIHKGLTAFTEFCESQFKRFPISRAIKHAFPKTPGINVVASQLGMSAPREWNHRAGVIDETLKSIEPDERKYSLTYISARLGFRETPFAITAPIQVIDFAATPRWSLMTLTHELLHGHVRALFGAIFSTTVENLKKGEPGFGDLAQQFNLSFHDGLIEAPANLLATTQNVFTRYVVLQSSATATANRPADQNRAQVKRMTSDRLRKIFDDCEHELNEIFVHVLDYHYFYDCDSMLYLRLLWASWSAVPAVYDRLDEYLFRSVIAVASNEAGDEPTRIEAAKREVQRCLQKIEPIERTSLIVAATDRIASPEFSTLLKTFLPLKLYITDFIRTFLMSTKVHAALYDDANRIKASDGSSRYSIDEGEFSGSEVKSPVAFVSDMLRREESHSNSIEFLSAWIFVVCASVSRKRGNHGSF